MSRRDRRQRGRRPAEAPLDPRSVEVQRAFDLVVAGRFSDAEAVCRRVLARDRTLTDAHWLLARALREQGRLDEAMLAARRAATHGPSSAGAQTELGAVLAAQHRPIEALKAFERALEVDPDNADARNRHGLLMLETGRLDEALESFRRVAELIREHPSHYGNIGATLSRMGDYRGALEAYNRGLERFPDNAALRYSRSFARMALGDLDGGWADQELGFEVGQRQPRRNPPVARWEGGPLEDHTIFVWPEQGLGDEVRFASCFPDVIAAAATVVIECSDRLLTLFTRSFPEAQVRAETVDRTAPTERATFEGIDLHAPSGSLPRYFRRSLDEFPSSAGYLTPDAAQVEHWRQRLSSLGEGLKVGVAWRSMNLQTLRLAHYLTLPELAPLLTTPGIEFVNLQYGPADQLETELNDFEAHGGPVIHRWGDIDYTNDLEAVAALTSTLDAVVGPGSFPTVLSGALDVPTFVLTAETNPWNLGREHDPWFPSTLHVPRSWDQSWERAVSAVADELSRRAVERAS